MSVFAPPRSPDRFRNRSRTNHPTTLAGTIDMLAYTDRDSEVPRDWCVGGEVGGVVRGGGGHRTGARGAGALPSARRCA